MVEQIGMLKISLRIHGTLSLTSLMYWDKKPASNGIRK